MPPLLTFIFVWLAAACLQAAELPDIRTVPADLEVPALSDGPPAPGKRVKQGMHVLYLPMDWKPGAKMPVIVELAGNGNYSNKYGDVSKGVPEGSNLGYGLSGGKGFIWLCAPYLNNAGDAVAIPDRVGGDEHAGHDTVGDGVAQVGPSFVNETRAAGEKKDRGDNHDAAGERGGRGKLAEEGDGGQRGRGRSGAAGWAEGAGVAARGDKAAGPGLPAPGRTGRCGLDQGRGHHGGMLSADQLPEFAGRPRRVSYPPPCPGGGCNSGRNGARPA